MTLITSYHSRQLLKGYPEYLQKLIETFQPKTICDIGGGRNPQLDAAYIQRQNCDYTILDISAEELARAPDGYRKLEGDIGSPRFSSSERFDFVFSRMVAEHVKDGRQFHRNVYNVLNDGGTAFHFFPTLFAVPFVANYLMPEQLSDRVLDLVSPRDRNKQGKFPAYYSWTLGPTKRQIHRLEQLGYEVTAYIAGFGHSYYRRVPLLSRAGDRFARHLIRHPVFSLTSYAYLILRKPHADHASREESSREMAVPLPWRAP